MEKGGGNRENAHMTGLPIESGCALDWLIPIYEVALLRRNGLT